MSQEKFSLVEPDDRLTDLFKSADHRTAGLWARDCALRVLPYFQVHSPEDNRPQLALNTLQDWLDSGEFTMRVIRTASLGAHAAARAVGRDNSARSAARSAGQAVASAHVAAHALAAARYALQAIDRASRDHDVSPDVNTEREWQRRHLQTIIDGQPPAET